MGVTLSADELKAIFAKYDKDQSNSLDFEEFTNLALEHVFKVIRESEGAGADKPAPVAVVDEVS
jgi:Ca2+-binding EF-hand superfamily protein